jgi:hypothetical protein
MPDASAPAANAASWHADNGAHVGVARTIVGVNLPLLLLFTASLRALVRESYPARSRIDLGSLATVVLAALFGLVTTRQVAAAHFADGGATPATTPWSLQIARPSG